MKKILAVALFLMLNISLASASVVVVTDQGSKAYPDGSTLNIKAEKDMDVVFYGVKASIKKGEKVSLKCLIEDGKPMFYVSGDEIKGLTINKNVFTASSSSAMKIDVENGDVEVLKGNVNVTDKKGNTAFLKKGSIGVVDVYVEPALGIGEAQNLKTSNYIQAEKDVLSPSAPR